MLKLYVYGSIVSTILSTSISAYKEHDLYNTLYLLVHNRFNQVILINMALALSISIIYLFKSALLGQLDSSESELVKFRLRLIIPNFIYIVALSGAGDFEYCIPVNFALLFLKIAHWVVTDRLEKLGNSLSSDTQEEDVHHRSQLKYALTSTIIFTILDISFILFLITLTYNHKWAFISLAELLLIAIRLYEAGATIVASLLIPAGDASLQNIVFGIQLTSAISHVMASLVATLILTFITSGPPLFTLLEAISASKKVVLVLKNWREWRIQSGRLAMLPAPEDASETCTICQCPLNVPAFSEESQPSGNYGKKLTCSHSFHKVCLMRWFAQRQACPICQAPIALYALDPPSPYRSEFISSAVTPSRTMVTVRFNPTTRRLEAIAPPSPPPPQAQPQPHQPEPVPNHQQGVGVERRGVEEALLLRAILDEVRSLSNRVGQLERRIE
ncbi:hypothetical protein P9112_001878 [Eukaryota sp. TZLM1-RC]